MCVSFSSSAKHTAQHRTAERETDGNAYEDLNCWYYWGQREDGRKWLIEEKRSHFCPLYLTRQHLLSISEQNVCSKTKRLLKILIYSHWNKHILLYCDSKAAVSLTALFRIRLHGFCLPKNPSFICLDTIFGVRKWTRTNSPLLLWSSLKAKTYPYSHTIFIVEFSTLLHTLALFVLHNSSQNVTWADLDAYCGWLFIV